ncbi:MAG TPA: hypothetical protein VGO68_00760 [Pyrinomonadaceae bacterium]|jgi:hypothetical protein|nr:hypothetical protein [Pyrinomonadaceae bacterium]
MKLYSFRRISTSKLTSQLISIVLLLCVVVGCRQLSKLGNPTVLKSRDGKFQVTVPGGCRKNASLNKQAEIGAANLIDEVYVIVLTDAKTDFPNAVSLDEFTTLSRNTISSNLKEARATDPVPVTINGNSGRAYEVEGMVDGVKLAYRIAAVETSDHYHQVITWTLHSRKDENRATLQKMIDSFRST